MSSRPLIKICGVKTPDILNHVIAEGADMVGFVHFEKSPRHIPIDVIAGLSDMVSGRIETAILLVDPDDTRIKAAASTGADWLQLHGKESLERVAAIRAATGKKIIKALPVGGPEDIAVIPSYAAIADRLILDAKPPKDATRPGGLGEVFDWSLLAGLDRDITFMLSGGLTIDNVARAMREISPFGLDLSSGVERERGVKDAGLISAFIAKVRATARELEK
jgi:phosphoribosylanthranilate isomerase